MVLVEGLAGGGGVTRPRGRWGGGLNPVGGRGDKGHARTFGFNGHTDVVPLGNPDAWTMPPFGAEIKDGMMYGRGSTDMKSGVAAFAAQYIAAPVAPSVPPRPLRLLQVNG